MKYRFPRYRRRSGRHMYWTLVLLLPAAFFVLWLVPSGSGGESDAAKVFSNDSAVLKQEIVLSVHDTGAQVTLPLETYVIGVVAAEMPSSFEPEALKAQAVIARSYALGKIKSGAGTSSDGHGDLCDDPGHCQAYYDKAYLEQEWGADFTEKYQKVSDAVTATAGQVLTYEGGLAQTFYHSTCGGKTASAKEVWGEEIPYLQSVTCKWDRDAPRYRETFTVSLSDLPWLLGDGSSPCIAVAEGETVTVVPTVAGESDSGRIEAVSYAGLMFDAADFRRALGLNSTRFTLESDGETLKVTTYGFGHGVGLCQYGANGMAKDGKTYDEILSYYYQGTELTTF
ncbi:MAG: stage II sporulation protein D [Clostridia bacterium]